MNDVKSLMPYEIKCKSDICGEIWKRLEECPNYCISNFGRVKSMNYYRRGEEKMLIQSPYDKCGHLNFGISNQGERFTFPTHQMVAKYFCENPNNYKEIDHIDGNPQNNHYTNLRYCTHQDNMCNPITKERLSKAMQGVNVNNPKLSKEIVMLDIDGNFEEYFPSSMEIVRKYGYTQSNISLSCHSKYSKHKKNVYMNHLFYFLDDYLRIIKSDKLTFFNTIL